MVTKQKVLYNIVTDDGERTSVSVFIGSENLVATKDHQNFVAICEALTGSATHDVAKLRGMFSPEQALQTQFHMVSERVSIKNAQVYFDGDQQDGALVNAIVNFYMDGNQNFLPLVKFMEKIKLNPTDHSRDQLFNWLSVNRFAICEDGDFIAYKSVKSDFKSEHSGYAIVNGVEVNGRVPNKPGTVVEMPRSMVKHDPSDLCSVGLHAASWGYAKHTMSGQVMLRVKINPRDVVSVPNDHSGAKMRVCRYRVMDNVESEVKDALYVGKEKTLAYQPKPAKDLEVDKPTPPRRKVIKPASKEAPAKPLKFPRYYEQFTKEHFEACDMAELNSIASTFEVKLGAPRTKPRMVALLVREAKKRLATW